MPAPIFSNEQLRRIREEFAAEKQSDPYLLKVPWMRRKAEELGCSYSTIKRALRRFHGRQKEWTYQEVLKLKECVALELTDAQIAKTLKRPLKSVQLKRERLKIRTARYARDHKEEIARLVRLGMYDREIGERLGFTAPTICTLRNKLRMTPGRSQKGRNIDDRGIPYPPHGAEKGEDNEGW